MVTPQDEPDRITERLRRERSSRIVDKDSFNFEFNRILGRTEKSLTTDQKKLRRETFEQYASRENISRRNLFKEAGGKNLKQDRKTQAREVTTSKKVFLKKGAQKTDFKGLDDKFVFRQEIRRGNKTITIRRNKRGRFSK